MQSLATYDDVAVEVAGFLRDRVAACEAAGIPRGRIAVDPGIGFGKTMAHNLALIDRLPLLTALGCRVVLGASRKRFIGTLSGVEEVAVPTGSPLAAALAVLLAVALLLADELGAMAGRPLGVLVMLGAAICWAVGTLMMRRATITLPMEALTVWMMAVTSVALWVLAWTFEPWPTWSFSPRMWALLAYGVVLNYGFAQIIWFSLARGLPPATSAMSVMMVPLIGTASATVIAGEWPRWQDGVAVVCVMVAIASVLLPTDTLERFTRRSRRP